MLEKRIAIQEGDALTLTDMASNVTIAGWDQADLLIRVQSDSESDLGLREVQDGCELAAKSDTEIRAPAWMSISIRQVAGNLKVSGMQAPLHADQVRGDLTLNDGREASLAEVSGSLTAARLSALRVMGTVYGDANLEACGQLDLQNVRGNLRASSVGEVRVSRVSGNLRVQGCEGALSVERIGGNAAVEGIGGACRLDSVAGNLAARDLGGGAHVGRIGGNLALNGSLGRGHTYHFQADGNAAIRLGKGPGAHLHVTGQGSVVSAVPLTDSERVGHTLTGTFGEGGCEVGIEAGGNVLISSREFSGETDRAEEIARQVEESLRALDLDAIGRQVSDEMEAALSRLRVKLQGVNWDQVGLQSQEAIERAMARMQQNLDRLAERGAREVEKQIRRQERLARKLNQSAERWSPAASPREATEWEVQDAGTTAPEPDREEERLTILRMVEQGQITPEEAEMLLDALG